MEKRFPRGTQIAYIPNHAEGDIAHPDVELGFVTSGPNQNGAYFCRYWIKRKDRSTNELRTKANSELTPGENLVQYFSHDQELVEKMLKGYC